MVNTREYNKKRFSIFESEEKTALELINSMGDQINYNTDEIDNLNVNVKTNNETLSTQIKDLDNKKLTKTEYYNDIEKVRKIDVNGNFTGSWYGISSPEYAEPGQANVVNQNKNDITVLKKSNDEKKNIYDDFINALSFIRNDGSFIVIGDSISAGYGLSHEDQYVTKLFNKINKYLNKNDLDINCNFQEDKTLTIDGYYTFESVGPCKKAIKMQPNSTIKFTCNAQYIDLIFNRTSNAGMIEVYKDGIKYKTIDCKGENAFTHSFPTDSSHSYVDTEYTLKCIGGDVTLIGIIRLSQRGSIGGVNYIRCAVSGENTTYFADDTTLEYIDKLTSFSNVQNRAILIALGTNNIYNSSKATTVQQYVNDIEKMIIKLKNDYTKIILTIPPIPNETLWPPVITSHAEYSKALRVIGDRYNCKIIDYSFTNFEYQDGVHPNINGTEQMLKCICSEIGKGFNDVSINSKVLTLENNFTNVGLGYIPNATCTRNDKIVILNGMLNISKREAMTSICTLPEGYRPKYNKVFSCATELGCVQVYVGSNGTVNLPYGLEGKGQWISLDSIIYSIN